MTLAVISYQRNASGFQAKDPASRVYYAESWKKGNRPIQEQRFYRRLNADEPSFNTVVKDSSGSVNFGLLVAPFYYVRDAQGKLKFKPEPTVPSARVNFWQVKLFEPGADVSLLVANKDQGDLIDWRNTLAVLNPVEDDKGYMVGISGVPISSKRVIKVESFYCILNILNYELNPKQLTFEWLEIEIILTNNRPDFIDRALR